jgi:hypothetical protein
MEKLTGKYKTTGNMYYIKQQLLYTPHIDPGETHWKI